MLDSLVKDVEHRSFFIDSDLQTAWEGDVADDDAESDRHQKQRLPVFLYSYCDERHSYAYHYEMWQSDVSNAGILHEMLQAFYNDIHDYLSVTIVVPSSTESPFDTLTSCTVPPDSA